MMLVLVLPLGFLFLLFSNTWAIVDPYDEYFLVLYPIPVNFLKHLCIVPSI